MYLDEHLIIFTIINFFSISFLCLQMEEVENNLIRSKSIRENQAKEFSQQLDALRQKYEQQVCMSLWLSVSLSALCLSTRISMCELFPCFYGGDVVRGKNSPLASIIIIILLSFFYYH